MAASQKIAIVGPAYPLRGGGMATFNERLARQFLAEGHKVNIYTFSLQYPGFLFPGTTQYSTEAAPADLDIDVLINSVNPVNWLRSAKKIAATKPDLLIVRYWLPFMAPALGTILKGIKKRSPQTKIIAIADNIVPHEKRPGDELFTKYFVRHADAFIVMSKNVQDDLMKFTNKPNRLVHHPLYDNFGEKINKVVAKKELGIDPQDFTLLFFGFIRQYKGLDILLEAMPEVAQKVPGVKLIIAGEFYGDPSLYLRQIEKLNLSKYLVLHTRFISDAEVRTFFSAADLVVQPYRNATQSGVTPLAYHFDVPMVVTNVGALPDMVPDGFAGIVTEPDAKSIAAGIIRAHAEGINRFQQGIAKQKELYSWAAFTESVLELASSLS